MMRECVEILNLQIPWVTLVIMGINMFYWIFMETAVRTSEAKIVGTKESKIIPNEYKNTSSTIVLSTVLLYSLSTLWRLFDYQIFPLICYHSCGTTSSWMFEVPTTVLPIILSIFAFLFRYWSMNILGKYFSRKLVVQGSQEIICQGPYALVRHPGYAANVLLFLVYSMVVSGDFIFGLLLWIQYLFVLLSIRIPGEEEMLLSNSQTAEGYKRYQQRVKYRILPFLL